MQVQDVELERNSFKAKFCITEQRNRQGAYISSENTSIEYVLNTVAMLQVRVACMVKRNSNDGLEGIKYYVFVNFVKRCNINNVKLCLLLTSNDLGISNKQLTSGDDIWHLVNETYKTNICGYTFDISVRVNTAQRFNPFCTLHDDNLMTDFELRGCDGCSVRVHRAALAAASPVLRSMLSGTWREAGQGHVVLPDVSAVTLQHFKDYIYLYKLPDSGLEQLLLLASCYMMPELEQGCVYGLVVNISAKNAADMIEFAAKHKITSLLLAVLECVKHDIVDINEMYALYNSMKIQEDEEEETKLSA